MLLQFGTISNVLGSSKGKKKSCGMRIKDDADVMFCLLMTIFFGLFRMSTL